MSKILCLTCSVEMLRKQSGVPVIETYRAEEREPYKIWLADLFYCPNCYKSVVADFDREPFANNFQDDFSIRYADVMNSEMAKNGLLFYDHEK